MAVPLRTGRSASFASMRSLSSFSSVKAQVQVVARPVLATTATSTTESSYSSEALTQKLILDSGSCSGTVSRACFEKTGLHWFGAREVKPTDPNKAKLGKTLRILQERLPTLLQSPLPQDIMSPNISLQLFPSTHPHLPTVSGRVAYNAALWTSPIAWNRVPIIGNVKLEILAERMTSEPLTFIPRPLGAIPEQLVVRWCEKRKCDEAGAGGMGISLRRGVDPNKAFTGLFIFDFDNEGRILTHTIEQAQEGGNWEKGMGAKFVGLTDWLLGGLKDPGDTPIPHA